MAARRLALFERLRAAAPPPRVDVGATLLALSWSGEDAVTSAALPRAVPPAWRPVEALRLLPSGAAASPVVGVNIDGEVRGLAEPLALALPRGGHKNQPVAISLVRFESAAGRLLFQHSAAHVLGAALEATFGDDVLLADGPALGDDHVEGGFFYEMLMAPRSGALTDETLPALEAAARKVVALRAPFERLELSLDVAADLFAGNRFKLDVLARLPPDAIVTAFRCGPFVDLCRGPHVQHAGVFKALRLFKLGGSHWLAQPLPAVQGELARLLAMQPPAPAGGELLRRVYGIAFPTAPQLVAWQHTLDEARRRDHRVIGAAQQLFFFHRLSPGSAFLLPHGTRIYNRLVAMLRAEYRARGYEEVRSPLVFKSELWRTSGHLQAYADNMYSVAPGFERSAAASCADATHALALTHAPAHSHSHVLPNSSAAEEALGLKPMNCPGHCLIFANRAVSYRDLPVRLADFSALHRNEASGALGGLTRLRRFAQDDAHIFCGEEHVEAEVVGCLRFVAHIYALFGFSFRMKLSTRPVAFVGDVATWDHAEAALRAALRAFLGQTAGTAAAAVEVDEGGGSFYGPKVDVFVRDALGREHQCATVQLDFQLPTRFGLRFKGPGNEERVPVIIHRAILGSIERMMGVLAEHTAGKWPFWLSPRQVLVCPVAERHVVFARTIAERLMRPPIPGAGPGDSDGAAVPLVEDSGLWVDVDDSPRSVGKKVREGQIAAYNLIAVVGDAEASSGGLAMRFRDAATLDAFNAARLSLSRADVARAVVTTMATAAAVEGAKGAAVWSSPLVELGSAEELQRVCARMALLRR